MWKDEKYSAVVRALDGALPIPEECPHPCTSIALLPESQPVVVKDEPTEEPLSIPETQISQINEVTTIPETQIISLNKDSSNMPEKELSPSRRNPHVLVIKPKPIKQLLKLLSLLILLMIVMTQ